MYIQDAEAGIVDQTCSMQESKSIIMNEGELKQVYWPMLTWITSLQGCGYKIQP